MPYTPPFRTRRGSHRLVEPHLGDPGPGGPAPDTSDNDANKLGKTLTWTTASAQPLADDAMPATQPLADEDDDALPVLTQLVEPPAAPVPALPVAEPAQPTPAPVDESGFVDDELVARITDEVLDALQPVLHDLVGGAVRRALEDHLRQGNQL